jgi:hypothetical protein
VYHQYVMETDPLYRLIEGHKVAINPITQSKLFDMIKFHSNYGEAFNLDGDRARLVF